MMSARDRYHYDYKFRNMVDAMYMFLEAGDTTPTEVREAAMLAQIIYEERHIRPVRLDDIDAIRKRT